MPHFNVNGNSYDNSFMPFSSFVHCAAIFLMLDKLCFFQPIILFDYIPKKSAYNLIIIQHIIVDTKFLIKKIIYCL